MKPLCRWLGRGLWVGLASLIATSASALTVVPPTFSELVACAESIVRTEVVDTRAEWRRTTDGRPFIVTLVTLKIEATLKGSPSTELVLTQLGGRIGETWLAIPGLPHWQKGDRDFLFVAENGRVICPLVGLPHGRFWIVRDPSSQAEYIARNNGAALAAVADVANPLTEVGAAPNRLLASADSRHPPLTAPEFETAVRSEVARQTANPNR